MVKYFVKYSYFIAKISYPWFDVESTWLWNVIVHTSERPDNTHAVIFKILWNINNEIFSVQHLNHSATRHVLHHHFILHICFSLAPLTWDLIGQEVKSWNKSVKAPKEQLQWFCVFNLFSILRICTVCAIPPCKKWEIPVLIPLQTQEWGGLRVSCQVCSFPT